MALPMASISSMCHVWIEDFVNLVVATINHVNPDSGCLALCVCVACAACCVVACVRARQQEHIPCFDVYPFMFLVRRRHRHPPAMLQPEGITEGPRVVRVQAPVQVDVPEEMPPSSAAALVSSSGLTAPLLVKPLWTDGRDGSHGMHGKTPMPCHAPACIRGFHTYVNVRRHHAGMRQAYPTCFGDTDNGDLSSRSRLLPFSCKAVRWRWRGK